MSDQTPTAEFDAPENAEARLRRHLAATTGGIGPADLDAVLARAWDEGRAAAQAWVSADLDADVDAMPNPYRTRVTPPGAVIDQSDGEVCCSDPASCSGVAGPRTEGCHIPPAEGRTVEIDPDCRHGWRSVAGTNDYERESCGGVRRDGAPVVMCGDDGRGLPCPVCKGTEAHRSACPVPVLGGPTRVTPPRDGDPR